MRFITFGNGVQATDASCKHCGARIVRPSTEESGANRRSSVKAAAFYLLLLVAGAAVWFGGEDPAALWSRLVENVLPAAPSEPTATPTTAPPPPPPSASRPGGASAGRGPRRGSRDHAEAISRTRPAARRHSSHQSSNSSWHEAGCSDGTPRRADANGDTARSRVELPHSRCASAAISRPQRRSKTCGRSTRRPRSRRAFRGSSSSKRPSARTAP